MTQDVFIQVQAQPTIALHLQVQQQVSKTAGRLRKAVGERAAAVTQALAEQQKRLSKREPGSSDDRPRWPLLWGKGRKRGEGFQL